MRHEGGVTPASEVTTTKPFGHWALPLGHLAGQEGMHSGRGPRPATQAVLPAWWFVRGDHSTHRRDSQSLSRFSCFGDLQRSQLRRWSACF